MKIKLHVRGGAVSSAKSRQLCHRLSAGSLDPALMPMQRNQPEVEKE